MYLPGGPKKIKTFSYNSACLAVIQLLFNPFDAL